MLQRGKLPAQRLSNDCKWRRFAEKSGEPLSLGASPSVLLRGGANCSPMGCGKTNEMFIVAKMNSLRELKADESDEQRLLRVTLVVAPDAVDDQVIR